MTTKPDTMPAGLGLGRRIALAMTGASGLLATTAVVSLWSTEAEPLPTLTQVAFGAIAVIGVCWAALAVWTLSTRRSLFSRDRVLAGSIATGAATIGLGIVAALVVTRGWSSGVGAAVLVAVLQLVAALWLLQTSRTRHRALLERRRALEAELGIG